MSEEIILVQRRNQFVQNMSLYFFASGLDSVQFVAAKAIVLVVQMFRHHVEVVKHVKPADICVHEPVNYTVPNNDAFERQSCF